MCLYDEERERNPRRFRVDVTANIDPCKTCVIAPFKHLKDYYKEHCSDCKADSDKKNKINAPLLNTIVLMV